MIVLHIDSSPRGDDSVSRNLTRQIIDRLKAVEPSLEIARHDLGDRPLLDLSSDAIGAWRRAECATAEQREVSVRSDRMIERLSYANMGIAGCCKCCSCILRSRTLADIVQPRSFEELQLYGLADTADATPEVDSYQAGPHNLQKASA